MLVKNGFSFPVAVLVVIAFAELGVTDAEERSERTGCWECAECGVCGASSAVSVYSVRSVRPVCGVHNPCGVDGAVDGAEGGLSSVVSGSGSGTWHSVCGVLDAKKGFSFTALVVMTLAERGVTDIEERAERRGCWECAE